MSGVNTHSLMTAAHRVALELHAVETRVEHVEAELDQMLQHQGSSITGETIAILQQVDLVRQSINALANFLDTLSENSACDCTMDISIALEKIPLRDLRAHLTGGDRSDHCGEAPELF